MGTVKWRVITILVVVLIQMITLQAYFSFRSKSEVSPTSAPVTEIADEVTSTPQQLTVIPDRVDQEPQPPVEIEPIQEPIITVTAPEISAEVELEEPTREEVQVEPVVVASEPVIETPSQEKVVETSEVATKEVAAPVFTSVEDDWADFYIAGEEDYSIFQNDSYYVPLFVNDEYLTDINVTFTDETLFISVLEFRGLISELLTDSFEKEFFGTTKKNFTLDDLNNQGIEAWFDYQTFELRMYFPSWMMPVRLLSINKGNLTRYSAYSMSGSEFINPSWFSWFGNVSMFSLIDMSQANNWKISPVSLFSMQSRNSISLFDIAFDFSYSIHPGQAYNASLTDPWSSDIKDYISFHGIQGFYDFKETSQRLTFGNVNDYLGYSTDSIGIALEKRYNYGDVKPKNHQYEYSVTLEEPSTVEVFINQRSVYRRELQAGVYKLRDFAFTQGANNAQVVVTSLADPTQIQEYDFLLGYDSRLLARGDTLYTLSLSFPDYNIGQTIFRAEQQLGLTDTITSSYNLAFSPSAITLGLSSLFATPWGSIDALLGFSYSNPLALGFSSRLSYRVAGKDESPFGSFDFSVGYTTQEYSTRADISPTATATAGNTVELNTSYAAGIADFLRYSLSGGLLWNSKNVNPTWRVTASVGVPLIPNMSVNGSMTLYTTATVVQPIVRGQIGLNYTFTPNLNVSASSDLQTSTYVNASWRPLGSQKDNMQFSVNNINFTDLLNHQGSISWSHSASAYGLSLRQQYSDRFTRFSTSIAFNTAFAYAGGMFGITRTIGENFLLVKPAGAMKGSAIAVTKTMTSAPEALPSLFGVSTYTGITTHQRNNVVVYEVGDSSLSNSGSFIYDFLPRPRQGYAVRIISDVTYSVVGTLLRSPTAPYSRYTTDLARVEIDENGEEVLVLDETLYLFTDESGFFFVSGVSAGEYQFSLFMPKSTEEDLPVDIRFTITPEGKSDKPQVFVLETFVASKFTEELDFENFDRMMGKEIEDSILDDEGRYRLAVTKIIDETTFWDDFYPGREIVASITTESLGSPDSIIEKIANERQENSALKQMANENELKFYNLNQLRLIVKPYLDAITPENWNFVAP